MCRFRLLTYRFAGIFRADISSDRPTLSRAYDIIVIGGKKSKINANNVDNGQTRIYRKGDIPAFAATRSPRPLRTLRSWQ